MAAEAPQVTSVGLGWSLSRVLYVCGSVLKVSASPILLLPRKVQFIPV